MILISVLLSLGIFPPSLVIPSGLSMGLRATIKAAFHRAKKRGRVPLEPNSERMTTWGSPS